jgi:hypothetical protein
MDQQANRNNLLGDTSSAAQAVSIPQPYRPAA